MEGVEETHPVDDLDLQDLEIGGGLVVDGSPVRCPMHRMGKVGHSQNTDSGTQALTATISRYSLGTVRAEAPPTFRS